MIFDRFGFAYNYSWWCRFCLALSTYYFSSPQFYFHFRLFLFILYINRLISFNWTKLKATETEKQSHLQWNYTHICLCLCEREIFFIHCWFDILSVFWKCTEVIICSQAKFKIIYALNDYTTHNEIVFEEKKIEKKFECLWFFFFFFFCCLLFVPSFVSLDSVFVFIVLLATCERLFAWICIGRSMFQFDLWITLFLYHFNLYR